jgi:hypothetical protein
VSHWESSGKSSDWYTPAFIFDALGCTFDLDVAGARIAASSVPAREIITEGSLEREWHGFIWANPPFGGRNGLAPWLDKFFAHGNGIALTPDRTSAPWWQAAARRADAILFIDGKVRFLRPDGSEGVSPSNGTTLFAAGSRGCVALGAAQAKGLGFLMMPPSKAWSFEGRSDSAKREREAA